MTDPENPEVVEAAAESEEAVAEEEDADLANASEWGDEEEDETMEEATPGVGPTALADDRSEHHLLSRKSVFIHRCGTKNNAGNNPPTLCYVLHDHSHYCLWG